MVQRFFQKWSRLNLYKRLPNLRQIKYLSQILNKKEKKIIVFLLAISLLSFFLLLGRIYFLKSEIKPKIGGKYIEGLIGEPKLINPILATNDIDLALSHLIFSGLLKYNKDLELKPDLVESLSSSEDQKEYTFCLRQNIFWHDGEKLTVDDVIFTYELIKNPDFKNPFLERSKELTLSRIDENCLQFNLEKKSNFFLSLLTEFQSVVLGYIPLVVPFVPQKIVPNLVYSPSKKECLRTNSFQQVCINKFKIQQSIK
ncbi:hypothetical protein IID20_03605 [Patescibacteria group bacterium]|nr:hypothetical protein [Patescibacteria group bacterium]